MKWRAEMVGCYDMPPFEADKLGLVGVLRAIGERSRYDEYESYWLDRRNYARYRKVATTVRRERRRRLRREG